MQVFLNEELDGETVIVLEYGLCGRLKRLDDGEWSRVRITIWIANWQRAPSLRLRLRLGLNKSETSLCNIKNIHINS
jgi:hypothetical protein